MQRSSYWAALGIMLVLMGCGKKTSTADGWVEAQHRQAEAERVRQEQEEKEETDRKEEAERKERELAEKRERERLEAYPAFEETFSNFDAPQTIETLGYHASFLGVRLGIGVDLSPDEEKANPSISKEVPNLGFRMCVKGQDLEEERTGDVRYVINVAPYGEDELTLQIYVMRVQKILKLENPVLVTELKALSEERFRRLAGTHYVSGFELGVAVQAEQGFSLKEMDMETASLLKNLRREFGEEEKEEFIKALNLLHLVLGIPKLPITGTFGPAGMGPFGSGWTKPLTEGLSPAEALVAEMDAYLEATEGKEGMGLLNYQVSPYTPLLDGGNEDSQG